MPRAARGKFAPICPDFAIELRSPSDSLGTLREKCEEYVANGAKLVWLVDPVEHRVHVYEGESVTILERPKALSGGSVLPGLSLDLHGIL